MTSFTWRVCDDCPHRWPWYFLNSWNLVFARKQGQGGFGKRTHVQKKECWLCVKAGWSNKWVTFIDNQKVRVTSRQVALVSSRALAEQLCWVSLINRDYRIVTRADAEKQLSLSSGAGETQIWSSLSQTWVMFTWLCLHGLKSHYSHIFVRPLNCSRVTAVL